MKWWSPQAEEKPRHYRIDGYSEYPQISNGDITYYRSMRGWTKDSFSTTNWNHGLTSHADDTSDQS